jgi:hypothetical protein
MARKHGVFPGWRGSPKAGIEDAMQPTMMNA